MRVTTGRSILRITVALVAALAAACSDRAKPNAATDSDLVRDLALAGNVTAQPTFQDTALAPTSAPASPPPSTEPRPTATRAAALPRRRAQAPTPNAPEPAVVAQIPASAPVPAPIPAAVVPEIGVGSGVSLASGARVCTNTNRPGDKLVATVDAATTGVNGAVIPAGARVVLEVASATPGDSPEGSQITFRVKSLYVNDVSYPVVGEVASPGGLERAKVGNDDPNADKKKVIGGAIAGAILGQMMGKNTKSTIIGAAAGAAAGTAVAKSGTKWESCLPAGSPMRLTLTEPLVMR